MRTSSNTLWLLVVVGMLTVVAARLSRSLGAFGLILTVFLVIVLIRLLRDLLQTRFGRGDDDRQRAATKNVTPQEGWLPPGVTPTGVPAARPAPSVIVVDPPGDTERLELKLEALDRLRASGLMTDDEYEARRAQLIADF